MILWNSKSANDRKVELKAQLRDLVSVHGGMRPLIHPLIESIEIERERIIHEHLHSVQSKEETKALIRGLEIVLDLLKDITGGKNVKSIGST